MIIENKNIYLNIRYKKIIIIRNDTINIYKIKNDIKNNIITSIDKKRLII